MSSNRPTPPPSRPVRPGATGPSTPYKDRLAADVRNARPKRMPPGPTAAHSGGGRRPAPNKRPQGNSSGLFKVAMIIILFLFVVIGGGLGYLMLNPPSELIRQTFIEQVKRNTGRDLTIAGDASFAVFPGIGVRLAQVSLSGPEGATTPLAEMQSLDVQLKLIPLLSRRVVVDSINLEKPVINLIVDKSGQRNWDMAHHDSPVRFAQAATGTANDAAVPSSSATLQDFNLDAFVISDGVIRYSDQRTNSTKEITGLQTTASMPSLSSSAKANGRLIWRDQPVNFEGSLDNVGKVLSNQPARLDFKASNSLVGANYAGRLVVGDKIELAGRIAAKAPSVRNLAKWFGNQLPPAPGFGPLEIQGQLATAGDVTRLTGATFKLADAIAKGDIAVTTGRARPYVQARLNISNLDLNQYFGGSSDGSRAIERAPADQLDEADEEEGDAIEQLLKKSGTRVHGSVQRAEWSSDKINFQMFALVDVAANVAISKVVFQDIKLGQTEANIALQNRLLKTTINRAELYQGKGNGVIELDTRGALAGLNINFMLDDLAAQPFLRDAADIGWLAGRSQVTLDLKSQGISQLQLVNALDGTAGFTFTDGALVGLNIPGTVRKISSGQFGNLKSGSSEKTDFSKLSATFDVNQGVARNDDLSLIGPLIRATGSGTVSLPPKSIDYTLRPNIVASLEGQGGNEALEGLEIPIHITGSWSRPDISPDLSAVDTDKAVEAVKKIGKSLKGKDAGQIIDQFLGEGASETEDGKKAKDLLDQFLR